MYDQNNDIMNESLCNNGLNMNNMCRICLSTTKNLHPLSNEHIKLYISLVDHIVYKEHIMDVCTACQWMLRKFAKFKFRCWMANSYLKETVYLDSKSIPQNAYTSPHLTQTRPIIHSYNPTRNTLDSRNSIHTHKTSHELQHPSLYTPTHDGLNNQHIHNFVTFDDQNCHTNNDKELNDNNVYTDINNKYIDENNIHNGNDRNENDMYIKDNEETINDNCDTINDNYEGINDNFIDDYDVDEDDVPLILIKDKSKRKVKKKGRGKKKDTEDKNNLTQIDVKQETVKEEAERSQTEQTPRSKKPLRAGFSSRMVQETNEYIVIKLTKEQVLQEMSDRSKTAAYISSPFKCVDCVKAFNFQDVLDTHMEKHSLKNGTFLCDMCAQYCPSAVSLRGHIKSHTTRYECKLCGAVRASRQHLVEHHAAHSGAGPAYQCLRCDFTTNKRTVMQRHARRHSRTEAYSCGDCGKQFKTIDYLRLHVARHAKSPRFACAECPATSPYHSVLRRHVRDVHERSEFYCVECDVRFQCAESLRVHFKRAKRHRDSTALNHACPKCPARFLTASALGTHLASSHDAFKQHACQHCHRAYSTKDAVRAHIWRVHSKGDNRASCLHCGQTFTRKNALKAHMRTHEDANDARTNTQADKQEKDGLLLFEDKIEV